MVSCSGAALPGNQGAKKKALPEIEWGKSLEFGILHRVPRSDASLS
jgi:hypothetical protein